MNNNSGESLITLHNVGLCFRSYDNTVLFSKNRKKPFWALRKISFSVYDHDRLGIIGRNGAGKSTLSRLITGVYEPNEGTIERKINATLLTLGAGFNRQLSGRDNILINGAYLGFKKMHIRERFDEIVEFAELQDFIDEPIRTYSSGMRSRLAFSIACHLDPELLVLDETLATGDRFFRAKAESKLSEIMDKCRAMILISHQESIIQRLCNRAIWLEKGSLMADGPVQEVLKQYANSQNQEH